MNGGVDWGLGEWSRYRLWIKMRSQMKYEGHLAPRVHDFKKCVGIGALIDQ